MASLLAFLVLMGHGVIVTPAFNKLLTWTFRTVPPSATLSRRLWQTHTMRTSPPQPSRTPGAHYCWACTFATPLLIYSVIVGYGGGGWVTAPFLRFWGGEAIDSRKQKINKTKEELFRRRVVQSSALGPLNLYSIRSLCVFARRKKIET